MRATILVVLCTSFACAFAGNLVLFTQQEQETYGSRCLDGSPAGYYTNKATSAENANNWAIYLEGGGWCFANNTFPNIDDCRNRAKSALGSSKSWSQDNGYDFSGYNSVYIPYCSGDFWGGQLKTADEFGLYYSGHLIVEAVVQKLIKEQNLGAAKVVLLNGLSAGGIGTWVNFDFVQKSLPSAKFAAYSNAGWFPETFVAPNPLKGAITMSHAMSILYSRTKPYLNAACVAANPQTPYICYSAQHVYPYIGKTPVFIGQSFYDQWAAWYFHAPTDIYSTEATQYFDAFSTAMKLSLAEPLKSTGDQTGLFLTTDFVHDVEGSKIDNEPCGTVVFNWLNGKSPSREVSACKSVNCHNGDKFR